MEIADLCELSPMQQGMLFHSLYSPDAGVYVEQRTCRITGKLNVFAFQQAWQQVVDRHPILRTGFVWEVEKPLQIVFRQAILPWVEQDWRSLSSADQTSKLEAFLQHDRSQGFDFNQAPLMRCALFQVDTEAYDFVWTHHHLLMDGWCNAILLKEVLTYYDAIDQGRPTLLAPPVSFRNYITWLQEQDFAQVEKFWRQNLAGFSTPTDLPIDRAQRSTHEIGQCDRQQVQFDSNFTQALQTFAQQHHLTLNTLVQGAWAVLLSRYVDRSDVLFGATVSGRPPDLAGVESMIGLFINTLPVRVCVSPEADLVPWLQQLQSQQIERESFAYSALTDIQTWSEMPPATPLFSTLLVFENYPTSIETALQNWHSSLQISQSRGFDQTNYPLTLSAIPGECLRLHIDYDCDRFTSDTIDRLLKHLQMILAGMLTQPRLGDLSLLTEAEQVQFAAWNQMQQDWPQNSIALLFESQVERTPNAVAVASENQHFTYRELNAKANQLARHLQTCGVQPGSIVGVCLDRTSTLIVCLLAVLKAGATYVPLDPHYPPARLTQMLRGVSIVLGKAINQTVAAIDVENLQIEGDSTNLNQSIFFDQSAYIIYTSGSTGQPKGVLVSHRSLANYVQAAIEKFELKTGDRVLQFASISFDAAAEEIYSTLLSGAALVLRSDEMIATSDRFLTSCQDLQITVLDLPTAYWHQLVQESSHFPNSLRLVIIGGESASLACLTKWKQQTNIRLINTYGLTETTIVSTWWEAADSIETVSIGRPVPNTQIYVLDSHHNPVPVDVSGELYIAGTGVAQGYLDRPDLTADRFIPNPFNPGTRLYRTGDRVRYLSGGDLEFLGRIDNQIKLRGFRIELGEIENAIAQHPDVQAATVILQGDRLVAYVVAAEVSSQSLRIFLAQTLPGYMIPAAFVNLEALPLTSNGKIDRAALSSFDIEISQDLAVPKTASETPIEEILAGIWSVVLGIDRIGRTDNFFELGGHSLLATRVISQARQAFGIDLPLRSLFEHSTIATLAEVIQTSTQPSLPPILPRSNPADLPLSFAQQRQWILAQLEPDSPFYNIPAAVRLTGTLDVVLLEHSLNAIVQRHEVLRSTFATVDGQPVQSIAPLTLEMPVIDLNADEQVQQWAEREAKQAFALDRPPLLRVKLLRLSATDHVLLLTMHHIIADGWSIGVLVEELAALYQAFSQEKPSPLPDLPIQYADFAAWQRQQQAQFDRQLAYWQQQLQDAPVLELPTDFSRPAVRSLRGANIHFRLDRSLTTALKRLSQQTNCTLFMTLLAAFQTLLYRYTNAEDIVVGTAIANRNRAEIEGLIGFFVNTIALRTDLSGNPTFEELLHRVREVALAADAHQDLPFEQLVEALQPQRSLSYTPIFQVMFVLQNAPMPAIEIEDLRWQAIDSNSGTAKFDLTLSMQEAEGELTGSFEYSLDLFEAASIDRMIGHFQTLLEAIVLNPEQLISELPLLTVAEQQQIASWNQTQSDVGEQCVHQLFEQQVEKTPDTIALVEGDRQLSYQELNAKANQLAHHLKTLNLPAEAAIGVVADRSIETILSILAILKAGGAYVPLDPNYPKERLDFICENAQVSVIIGGAIDLNRETIDINSVPLNQYSIATLDASATLDRLAYVMYTSGSTGTPKGVYVPHRGIVRLVKGDRHINLKSETILQAAPLAFDASTFEIWGALLNGGRLVLLPTQTPSLAELGEAIAKYQITTLWLTAGLFHLMATEQLNALRSLHQLISGGDVLPIESVKKVLEEYPHCRLINGYGPTESATFACCYVIDTIDSASIPIGTPIANTQAYILDRNLQQVPVGIPGELYIGGDGLARGYLDRPDLTAERFIPNPFATGERLYKTGDCVRYRPDGAIEFLGRLDQQIKIRGFRIEPGEIEAALLEYPDVQAAIVLPNVQENRKRLIAYVVAPSIGSDTLRQFLTQKLPDYMIPSAFVKLETLPLTVNGKVDRVALSERYRKALPKFEPTPAENHAPRTAIEATLTQIWSDLLHTSVGIHDNFFELGGDSILAIQIIARANQSGLQLTPKQLFQCQTIAELAAVTTVANSIAAEQGIITGDVPLTPIQHWFFEQKIEQLHHFNQAVLLKIESPLNPAWLKEAIAHLQQHHDMLRSRFQLMDDGWQQSIAPPDKNVPLSYFDVSAIDSIHQQQAIEQAAQDLQTSLNLQETLMRVALFNLGDQQRLLIILHHLITDGISWRILLEDLQTVYQQTSQNQPVQLPAKTTSFKQWSERLQGYTPSTKYDWSIDHHPLPIDYSNGKNSIAVSDRVSINLSEESTHALLTEVPKAYNTRIDEVLLTAFVEAVASWTGRRSLLIDLENHGREMLFDDVDISRTVGWFTAIAPVLLNLENAIDSGDALKQVKEQLRQIPNRGIDYGILKYLRRDASLKTQAEICFNYLGQFDQLSTNFSIASESIGKTQSPSLIRPYLLEINGSIASGQLQLDWIYSTKIHRRETIAQLAGTFQAKLQELIEHCQLSTGGYTPSDFALAELDQSQLDAILASVDFGGEAE